MTENKYKFEKLTPNDNVNLEVYKDAIDYVFENPDVKNIAITGAYCSGKSSVLSSYKKSHKNIKFLHISLAHFRLPDEKKEADIKESVLEGKILNQLIHQIPADKIPQTNFRVKKRIGLKDIIPETIITMLLFLSFFHLCFFNSCKNYISTLNHNWFSSILKLLTYNYSRIVTGSIIIFAVCFFVYNLIKIQKNKNVFRKLNVHGNEIEIFEESDDSYFDKYLNEVLYLFENSEVDVIVFEDMDRYNNANQIFEHLHEVNTLVNIQLNKENKKVLRFFYLLRDDIFVCKDRTKFFDFILPIVPVIDSSNSYDQFISHFKNSGLFEKFEENFLQGLSLYIDDMRLLKNIYNEFLVYYNRLNITELNCNKMLAIIAYKNLFPKDFCDLQLNKGFVFTLFSQKDNFIKDEKDRISILISNKESEIKYVNKEHLDNVQELNDIYNRKQSRLPQSYSNNYSQCKTELDEWYNSEYPRRKKAIENRLKNQLPELENELSKLKQEKNLTENKQLHQIIARENINIIFSVTSENEIGKNTDFNEIKSSEYFDLLKYLVRNGHIDETYADYMTYFYEHSLSRIDKIFLRSITDKKAKEYTYQLKNPKLVISHLKLFDFEQEETLNFNLFEYLLQAQECKQFLEKFIDQLKNTKNLEFVCKFFIKNIETPCLVKNINLQWPSFLSDAFNENIFNSRVLTDNQIYLYAIYTLYYCDETLIKHVNQESNFINENINYDEDEHNDLDNTKIYNTYDLAEYISRKSDCLNISKPNIDMLIKGLKLLDVSFSKIVYDSSNKKLFDAVYENWLYEINIDNISMILQNIYRINDDKAIRQKNYSLIMSQPDSPLAQYINNKDWIDTYIDVIISLKCKDIIDDENYVLRLLNNENLDKNNKDAYIKCLATCITLINTVNDTSLWSLLLSANIVKYSEQNIIDYFINTQSLNESLILFINSGQATLDFAKLSSTYSNEEKESLFDAIIKCNTIKNEKYEQCLVSLGFYYDSFNVLEISNEKLLILIDKKIIRMTAETLVFIRENYPDQVYYFIKNNINQYVELMDNAIFDFSELIEILSWEISDEIKIKLLAFTDKEISIIENNYNPDVCKYILKNNFKTSDLCNLILSYEQWHESVQEIILDYAIKNISIVISNSLEISNVLTKRLLSTESITQPEKIELFIAMLPKFSKNEIKDSLEILNLSEYLKIFNNRSRPRFLIDPNNQKLLSALKDNDLIFDYKKDPNDEQYYKIERNKVDNSIPVEVL